MRKPAAREELFGLLLETALGRNGERERGHGAPSLPAGRRGAQRRWRWRCRRAAAQPRDQTVIAAAGDDGPLERRVARQFEDEAVIVFEPPARFGAEHRILPEGRLQLRDLVQPALRMHRARRQIQGPSRAANAVKGRQALACAGADSSRYRPSAADVGSVRRRSRALSRKPLGDVVDAAADRLDAHVGQHLLDRTEPRPPRAACRCWRQGREHRPGPSRHRRAARADPCGARRRGAAGPSIAARTPAHRARRGRSLHRRSGRNAPRHAACPGSFQRHGQRLGIFVRRAALDRTIRSRSADARQGRSSRAAAGDRPDRRSDSAPPAARPTPPAARSASSDRAAGNARSPFASVKVQSRERTASPESSRMISTGISVCGSTRAPLTPAIRASALRPSGQFLVTAGPRCA